MIDARFFRLLRYGLGQRRVVVRRGEEPLHGKLRGDVVPPAVEPTGPGAGADVNTLLVLSFWHAGSNS